MTLMVMMNLDKYQPQTNTHPSSSFLGFLPSRFDREGQGVSMNAYSFKFVSLIPNCQFLIRLYDYSRICYRPFFLRYVVKIDTQSDPESPTIPSTAKQKNLGKVLVEELKAIGIKDAELDEFGYIYATIPATTK